MKKLIITTTITLMLTGVASAGGFNGSDRSAPGPFRNHHDDRLEGKQRLAAGWTRFYFSHKIRHINKARRNGWIDRKEALDLIKVLREKRHDAIKSIHEWDDAE